MEFLKNWWASADWKVRTITVLIVIGVVVGLSQEFSG